MLDLPAVLTIHAKGADVVMSYLITNFFIGLCIVCVYLWYVKKNNSLIMLIFYSTGSLFIPVAVTQGFDDIMYIDHQFGNLDLNQGIVQYASPETPVQSSTWSCVVS